MSPTTRTAPLPHRTPRALSADELLEFERRRATNELVRCVRDLGPALVAATELRRHVRARPLLTTGAAVALGVISGRVVARTVERRVRSQRPARTHRVSSIVPALLFAALRLLSR